MERINWLDTLRGFAFLMVIYYHLVTREYGGIIPYFSPVFLTSFFFVSGYLTKGGMTFEKVFEQRTRTLFVPFLMFGLGGRMLLVFSKLRFGVFADGLVDVIKDVFYQYDDHQTLWFIASLYVYSLFFYWVDRWCRSHVQLLTASLVMIVVNQVIIYILSCPMLPWKINYSLWACGIMGLGKVYKAYEMEIDKILMKWWIAGISFMAYLFMIYIGKQQIVFWGSSKWFYAMFIPFTGMISMIFFSKKITINSKVLLFIGANTLLYFCLHRQVLNGVESVVNKILPKISMEPSVWVNLIEVMVIAALLAIPTWFINKYIPQVTGKGWKLWNV